MLSTVRQIADNLLQLAEGAVPVRFRGEDFFDRGEIDAVPVNRDPVEFVLLRDYPLLVCPPVAIAVRQQQAIAGLP
jgi:hypothetical protein